MIDHDRVEEEIIDLVLGGMVREERARFAAQLGEHMRTCDLCRTLYAGYSELAGRLALATPPIPPPASLEDRVVAEAAGMGPPVRAPSPRARLRRIALAAAAAGVLVAGSVAATVAVTRPGGGALSGEAVAVLTLPGTRLVQMEVADGGTVAFAYHTAARRSVVVGDGLAALPGGRVYELWLIGAAGPVPGAVFSPDDGRVVQAGDLATTSFDTVALTVEPSGGSDQPTTDPIAQTEVA
ncbi:MAG TPA: anti-sigma factor [Actinomycetota bacterium]|nr:anti-sigma factor [Actinomycetota bacterium]